MAGRDLLIVASAGGTALLALLACAAALIALVALGLALGRFSDTGALAAWRHAWREAGYRAAGVWAEFVDWLRTGSGSGTPPDRR